ncbi:SWIM zinc finger family protein [Halopenitus salinus]|uniref:SWIM zinc finger family protein n=1 Tax=Halopenitus salinus TaxID=1198295 RepID=A0ABD5UST9_9EURY
MTRTLLEQLDPPNRILKRAQYEAFAFSLIDGDVRVRNESHANPSEHEYRVTIVDGVPTRCGCPADAMYDGPCKHRVAIAIRPRILEVATRMQLVADGGVVPTRGDGTSDHADEVDTDQCTCTDVDNDFPCWECFRTGRKDLPK